MYNRLTGLLIAAPLVAIVALGRSIAGPPIAQPCISGSETNFSPITTTPAGSALSSAEASTTQVLEVVAQRRIQETQACAIGFVRISGTCQPLRGLQRKVALFLKRSPNVR